MPRSTASLQSSMLAVFVLLVPALAADAVLDALADGSHARTTAEATPADLPSVLLPEVVVVADRLPPSSLPEVVVVAERLGPISLPEVVVVAERIEADTAFVASAEPARP